MNLVTSNGKALTVRDQHRLREAWHGPMTAPQLAAEFGLASDQMVRKFWREQKSLGKLPQCAARPDFKVRTTLPPPPVGPGIDPVDIEFGDGEVQPPDSDAPLAALIAAHGNDRLRGLNDEMPAHTLEIERRDRDGHYTPSPARLIDFQKGRDAYARSKMAEPPAPSNVIYARVGRAWWIVQGLAMLAGPFLAFPAAQEWTRKFGTYHKKANP